MTVNSTEGIGVGWLVAGEGIVGSPKVTSVVGATALTLMGMPCAV